MTAGYRFKMALHEAIVADVDYAKHGCPFCGARPVQMSPPFVQHVHGECLLMGILERVDAVVAERAGRTMRL